MMQRILSFFGVTYDVITRDEAAELLGYHVPYAVILEVRHDGR